MSSHLTFSLIINYLALITTVWLGWYVITRSPRSLISWLTSLTLWSVGGLFLNMILALNPLSAPVDSPGWLRLLFPFWPTKALDNDLGGWLLGWQVTPAVVLWHHVTMLMRPGKMNWWRWSRVIFGYLVAIFAIWVQISTPLMFTNVSGDPLYLNTLKPGPLYLPFLFLLALFTILSLTNLFRSAVAAPASMPRRQLTTLGFATVTAGLTTPIAFISAAYKIPIPRTILTLLLTVSVVLIGFGVARYSALIEGRTIRRDFFYNALAMGLVILIYSLVTWISIKVFNVPAAAFVFVIMLVIITHNLIDATRRTLDFIFFKKENQQLRANYRKLANQIGEVDLTQNVTITLGSICQSVRATYGLVLLFEQNGIRQITAYNCPVDTISLPIENFYCDDVVKLDIDQLPHPLTEAALLVPLYIDTDQIGVILLGRPVNSTTYSDTDIELILYPSDQLTEAIIIARREKEFINQLSELAATRNYENKISLKTVETSFRNLYDYSLLGDSELAHLKLVTSRLQIEKITHLDRGKAVYIALSEALEKLRPDMEIPREPPPREWYPYLILHGAYIEDKPNREIMSQLFISEGTFNRTRRTAIRTITRVLEEMEATLH